MLDIKLFRESPQVVRSALQKRQMDDAIVDEVLALDVKRREIIQITENLKAERNQVSKEIGRTRDENERNEKIEAMRLIGERIAAADEELRQVNEQLQLAMATIPNIPDERTPIGKDEHDNVIVGTYGELPKFSFTPKPHWELGQNLKLMDFERGVKMSGSRFYVLSGALARLQRALIAFMLDLHIRQGYEEKYLPFMVKGQTLYGSGQLPKFMDNLYRDAEEDLFMVPTAEVPLTGYHSDEILDEESLPIYYTAYTPCFRREKMSAGRDVRGIKRGHQFDKVEMYIFCKPEESQAALEKMLKDAQQTCVELGLPYRVVQLCSGDLGFASQITYDIEVFAAGVNEWLEVSSVSLVGDFQARRANIKYKSSGKKGSPRYVHTLNGSGLGLPRTLIAVMENYQQEDGSILVPSVLKPWMGEIEVIRAT